MDMEGERGRESNTHTCGRPTNITTTFYESHARRHKRKTPQQRRESTDGSSTQRKPRARARAQAHKAQPRASSRIHRGGLRAGSRDTDGKADGRRAGKADGEAKEEAPASSAPRRRRVARESARCPPQGPGEVGEGSLDTDALRQGRLDKRLLRRLGAQHSRVTLHLELARSLPGAARLEGGAPQLRLQLALCELRCRQLILGRRPRRLRQSLEPLHLV
mmetsp:Transcript_14816/g.47839  ORF Transcript_14816/g.47839 Transcript_14816/m.47839 type:complete len:219 (+) Transcript_14816:173-829(+)